MKRLCLFLFLFSITSCASEKTYDNDLYEKVSKIKIPKSFSVIESFDNSDNLSITSFKAGKRELKTFIEKYKLRRTGKEEGWFRSSVLKKDKPNFNGTNSFIFIVKGDNSKTGGRNMWIYMVDMQKGILWAEIIYPGIADEI